MREEECARDERGPSVGPRGWHSRGYLPHFDGESVTQSVTFRLADSFPTWMYEAWRAELKRMPEDDARREERRRIEAALDKGHGKRWLSDSRVAAMCESTLLHFDGQRYALHAWCVMPNHVHALFTPQLGVSLGSVLKSWKSYSSHEANRLLGRTGRFWMEDYFDRFIRNGEHFANEVAYIERNPVKAGLCSAPEDWRWSSARRRILQEEE